MDRASATKLLAWRTARKLTQAQASKLAEIDQASWCQYEHGRIPRDVAVMARLVRLTRRTAFALAFEDFAETDEERERRRARVRPARSDESGTDLGVAAKTG